MPRGEASDRQEGLSGELEYWEDAQAVGLEDCQKAQRRTEDSFGHTSHQDGICDQISRFSNKKFCFFVEIQLACKLQLAWDQQLGVSETGPPPF